MAENTRTQELLSKIETLSQEEFDELIELVEGQPLDLEYDVAIMKRREELQQQTQTDEGYPLGYEFSEADFAVSDDEVVSAEEPEPEPVVEEPEPEPVEEIELEPVAEDAVPETVVEEPEPEVNPIEENEASAKPVIDKESLFKSFDKQSYEQLTMTLKATKMANDTEQVALIEEYVEKMAKDVNEGKKIILDIKDQYKWQALLNETARVSAEILTAAVNVDATIANFEEEFGLDNAHMQSEEQISANYDELKKLEKTDFFYRIDKPHAATWTGKEFDNWRNKSFTPVLQAYAGALRSPEYNNLSQEEKYKLLDEARLKLNDSASLDYRLTLTPVAYGDLRLIVDELKKTNPDNVAVKNADEQLARFVDERGTLLLYPQMEDANKALGQINVKGDLKLFGRDNVKQDGKDSEIARLKELARIETETYLANTTPAGETIDAQRFATEYAFRLNKNILALVQADLTAKGAKRDEINKTLDSFNAGKPVDVNQSTFSGYYAAQVMRHMAANDVAESKRPGLKEYVAKARAKIADFDKRCTEQYGNKYTVTKNVLKSLAWGAAFGVASATGPVAMAAVATVSFANQAWGIYKDYKTQKAKLVAQTEGKKQLTFREYAKNKENILKIVGACVSASTVAISGLGAMGVAVGPSIMSAKSKVGIGLALAGAAKEASTAMQQVREQNKHLPKDQQKSVAWAGLKSFGISAVSFGAGMLGGQMAGELAVGASAGGVLADNLANADNGQNQPVIDTQTPTNENTAPTQVVDTLNREQVLDSLNQENIHHQDTVAVKDSAVNTHVADTNHVADTVAVKDSAVNTHVADTNHVADSVANVRDTANVSDGTSVADSIKTDDATLKNIQSVEDKILNDGKQAQDAHQSSQEGVEQQNSGANNAQTANKEFWSNRADKFLGEDIKNNLYSRIDSGEIKLPEGIESKEEFAYKLAMAMEQSPKYVADALGVDMVSSNAFEAKIPEMTAEQFGKLGDLLNDYSDKGNYIGDNPFETTNTGTVQEAVAQSEQTNGANNGGVNEDKSVAEKPVAQNEQENDDKAPVKDVSKEEVSAQRYVETDPQKIDLSSFNIKEAYQVSNGNGSKVISITDNNNNLIFNETVDISPKQVEMLMPETEQLDNGMVKLGARQYFENQSYETLARQELSVLVCQEDLYNQIMDKETKTPGETEFIKYHEQRLDAWGLTHDKQGELVRMYASTAVHDADGVSYRFDKDGLHILDNNHLSDFKARDKVYQDLFTDRGGSHLGATEAQFIREHSEDMSHRGLMHNSDGRLVKVDDNVKITHDGAAYRINANIVPEKNVYGLSSQDYMSDAKELLGDTSKAADRMAVKSFLINDDIYHDLKLRQEAGETFSASEQSAITKFMTSHEQSETTLSEKYGIVRGDDGEMHKAPAQENTSVKAVTQSIPVKSGGRD
ncbi:MAG: hypothetical protein E7016_07190 [Alphaproteobacteria bacterium]|nr:hypothetical protein [Alphaproteobacteria bacterium]